LRILALDLGKFNTMCYFSDSKNRKHSFLNAVPERNYINTLFRKHIIDIVVTEACGPSGWINYQAISIEDPRLLH
jgi:transposase